MQDDEIEVAKRALLKASQSSISLSDSEAEGFARVVVNAIRAHRKAQEAKPDQEREKEKRG